jgi:UDP-N-acetylmuramyl pentapeptide phosphotransferase/UDP-N-acetylglucosamine-1-phosphate transferase
MSSAVLVCTVVAAALASGGLVMALLPLLRRHALARPNVRSSHRVSTPQGGGIAVIAATIAVSLAVAAIGTQSTPGLSSLWMLFAATALIALVGVVDDVRTIEVLPRLLLQALAVGIAIASVSAELRVVPMLPWWIERALMLLAGLWFVNLTNFMDGLDWMTVAEFVPMAAGLTLLGLLGALPAQGLVIALALGGALIGFAPFNRPVARLFLGDVGSLPIGLLIGWLLMLLAGNGHLAAAIVLPLYYLADATVTLLWRIAKREPFWRAHRSHFYQRATDRGFGVAEIIARVLAVNLALIALATATVLWPGLASSALALACGCMLAGGLLVIFARGRS